MSNEPIEPIESSTPTLPADDHVHSEWSWDAVAGAMEATCARARELGVPAIAFTEHADLTSWVVPEGATLPEHWQSFRHGDLLTPPPLDVDGYLACVAHCRERFPDVIIRIGVELGEPHWHPAEAAALVARLGAERVLASVHSAPTGDGRFTDVGTRYAHDSPGDVVRNYLAEVRRLVAGFDGFDVLAHIDYPLRYWPDERAPFDPLDCEDDYRDTLREVAKSGVALEVNTRIPLNPVILRWWRECGGEAITFASDAHRPESLAHGFAEAVAVARAAGFKESSTQTDFWCRD